MMGSTREAPGAGIEAAREAGEDRQKKTGGTLAAPCFVDAIDHWPGIEYRLGWIDRADRVANRFGECCNAHIRAGEQAETGPLRLRHRTINHRQRRHLVDGVKPHPRYDADNFRHDVAFLVIARV